MSGSLSMSFREFLKAKAEEYGIQDRHRLRNEWLASVKRLLDQLQGWLQQADPEEFLDIIRYDVARTERKLGTYNAPAMKIRLGAGEAEIVPISPEGFLPKFQPESMLPTMLRGRVDITDGDRKYNLYREPSRHDGSESWFVRAEHGEFVELTPEVFETMLRDLLS